MAYRNIKNVRIIQNLIAQPDGKWTKYGLAKASKCSKAWAIEFLRGLEKEDLVTNTKVKDIIRLAEYAVRIEPKPKKVLDGMHQHPLALLKTAGENYAITTSFAENEITHILFPTRCDVYVTEDSLAQLWHTVKNEGLIGRGNLRFILPVDDEIIKEAASIRGLRIVSFGRLMIDLVKEGGVCIQAVEEMVRRDVWKDRN